MASKRIQKWIEHGEEVKTNLAALTDSPLLVNSESQHELGEKTDGCTDGTEKRARKLLSCRKVRNNKTKDNENRADKPEKAPAKKRKKDNRETHHIDSQSNKENKGKQPKKGPVKSKTDKSKETRKQLSNIANKTTAENEACTKAVEESEDSDAEEETDTTTGVLFSPVSDSPDTRTSPNAEINITFPTIHFMERKQNVSPGLGEPTVMPTRIQQQMSPSLFLPPRVP